MEPTPARGAAESPDQGQRLSTALRAEIRYSLARNEMSRKDLAAAIGMHSRTLSYKLAGHSEFSVAEVAVIARHLHLTTAELFRRAEEAA